MERICWTRLVKNARFLQSREVGFLPSAEPLDGFPSLVPAGLLSRLERTSLEEVRIERLAKAISRVKPPRPSPKPVSPLFSGTLRFVQTTFSSGGTDFAVPGADLSVAKQHTGFSVVPIAAYASQYGPNSLAVSAGTIPFKVTLVRGKYNDSLLSRWTDQLARVQGFGADSCLVFLSPKGVVNTDGDVTKGVLGYHSLSSSGVPYIFVNVMGQGLTLNDRADVYAVALSHEIAEMTVDPQANGSNPEVCDPCAGNCKVDHRDYFDSNGNWLGGSPTPGYAFFIDGIATPATVAQCPAPVSSCSYPPPKSVGK